MPLILSYLRMKVRCLVIWYLNDCCICMRLLGYVYNFRDKNFFKGGENVKPGKNAIFLK